MLKKIKMLINRFRIRNLLIDYDLLAKDVRFSIHEESKAYLINVKNKNLNGTRGISVHTTVYMGYDGEDSLGGVRLGSKLKRKEHKSLGTFVCKKPTDAYVEEFVKKHLRRK